MLCMKPTSYTEARDAGAKRYFTGEPCTHGHVAERRTSNRACCECLRIMGAKTSQAHASRRLAIVFSERGYTTKRTAASSRADMLVNGARFRAKQLDLPRTITKAWVQAKIDAGVCEVTGVRFVLDGKDRHPFTPSLDRRDPKQGYTHENTQVVIWAYNAAKCDFTPEEFAEVCRILGRLAPPVRSPWHVIDTPD